MRCCGAWRHILHPQSCISNTLTPLARCSRFGHVLVRTSMGTSFESIDIAGFLDGNAACGGVAAATEAVKIIDGYGYRGDQP